MVLDKLGPGKKAPEEVNVFIEIPMGSNVKYELDKETGLIKVDRILFTAMYYPFNYGFVPGTLEEDGDPVDILVIGNTPLHPGVILKARPIGVLLTEDENGKDAKIVAVPVSKIDPAWDNVKDINDLPAIIKDKIAHFFEHYKELEKGKWVKVIGWDGRKAALKRIEEAISRYNESKK